MGVLKNDYYTYRVTWSEDDNEYVGLCTEFPNLSWLAEVPEAALKGIRKVVADVARDMKKIVKHCLKPLLVSDIAASLWCVSCRKFIGILQSMQQNLESV